jgi:hypothetical protein
MKISIGGTGLFDGEYELDLDGQPLDHYDAHVIKRIAGVRGGEMEDALRAGDTDMIVALAVVALLRAEKIKDSEIDGATKAVYRAPLGEIMLVGAVDSELSDVPPPSAPDETSEPLATGRTSGVDTNATSDVSPVTILEPIGHPA